MIFFLMLNTKNIFRTFLKNQIVVGPHCMEASFRHWIEIKKKVIATFYLAILTLFSHKCEKLAIVYYKDKEKSQTF